MSFSTTERIKEQEKKQFLYEEERNIHAPDVIDVRKLHLHREINKSLIKKTATNNHILICPFDNRL